MPRNPMQGQPVSTGSSPLAITGISPNTGSPSGGTSVTITGTGFTSASQVMFGSTAAASVTYNSSTSLTAVSPAKAAGMVDITVINTSATGTVDQFTFAGSSALTGIGATTGTVQVGDVLTAGSVTPSGATVSYQWQSCATSGGTYANISGATASTYTLQSGDNAQYIQVVATGTRSYTGTETSACVGPVTTALTAIGATTGIVSGSPVVGVQIAAGALTPSGATVTYQWQSCLTSGGTYANISGATSSTYTPFAGDAGYYIQVVATGTGSYTGSVTSADAGPTFYPTQLSGIQAWLDATQITGLTDGQNLSGWNEQINGWTPEYFNAHPTYKLSGINGKPSVQFGGTALLIFPSTAFGMLNNAPCALVAAVLSYTNIPSTRQDIVNANTATPGSSRILLSTAMTASGKFDIGGRRLDADSFASLEYGSIPATTTEIVIGILNYATATAYLYQNGALIGSGAFQTAGNTSNTASHTIGIGGVSSAFTGLMSELIIGNQMPSTAQIAQLNAYLSNT